MDGSPVSAVIVPAVSIALIWRCRHARRLHRRAARVHFVWMAD